MLHSNTLPSPDRYRFISRQGCCIEVDVCFSDHSLLLVFGISRTSLIYMVFKLPRRP